MIEAHLFYVVFGMGSLFGMFIYISPFICILQSLQHETFRFVLILTGLTVLHYFGIVYNECNSLCIYLLSFDSIHKQKPNKTENNLKINLKF